MDFDRWVDGFDDSGDGGNQNDTYRHDTGGDHQQCALLHEAIHISLHCLLGGVVNIGAGDQGDQADDQIGDGRVFPDSCHDLGVGSGKQGAEETAHGVAEAQLLCEAEHSPGQETAHGADPFALTVDVPYIEETGAGHSGADAGEQRRVDQRCRNSRNAPEILGRIPGGSGAQGHSGSDQQGSDHPVHTGIDVSENDVPEGIGEQKSRHQQHQGTDDGGIDVPCHTGIGKKIGKQCHGKAGGNVLEEGVGIVLAQKPAEQAQEQSAQTGADNIRKVTAVEQAQAAGHQHMAVEHLGEGILLSCPVRFLQPLQGHFRVRLLRTDGAAEIVVFFHGIQIGTNAFHPAQLGDGQLPGYHNGDKQAVGHRVDPGIQTIGGQHPDDAFLDAVGLRTGHRQPGAQLRGQFH